MSGTVFCFATELEGPRSFLLVPRTIYKFQTGWRNLVALANAETGS